MFSKNFQNDIDNCNPPCDENECNINAFQEIDVCVPITVEPYVNLGEAVVECLDDPYIANIPCCTKNKNGTCKFTIAQRLCVMVPIEFKASASSGPTSVICGDTSDEDCEATPVSGENDGFESDIKSLLKFYIKGKMVE